MSNIKCEFFLGMNGQAGGRDGLLGIAFHNIEADVCYGAVSV
jgi:hypothetical protein